MRKRFPVAYIVATAHGAEYAFPLPINAPENGVQPVNGGARLHRRVQSQLHPQATTVEVRAELLEANCSPAAAATKVE